MNNNRLEIKIHHKSINENDNIHFYSHHSTKIKSGIIIGFYLRAFWICIFKFLNDEFDNKENSFAQLQSPKFFI